MISGVLERTPGPVVHSNSCHFTLMATLEVLLPGEWTEEPGGLQSMGSHRVGHD